MEGSLLAALEGRVDGAGARALGQLRAQQRDAFQQQAQTPRAAGNGVGREHLRHLLDLMDAVLAVRLWQRFRQRGAGRAARGPVAVLLQALFGETPGVLELLVEQLGDAGARAGDAVADAEALRELVALVPAVRTVGAGLLARVVGAGRATLPHWQLLGALARRAPSAPVLELCRAALPVLAAHPCPGPAGAVCADIFAAFPFLAVVPP